MVSRVIAGAVLALDLTPLGTQDAQSEGEGGAFVGGGMMVERPARWMPPERLVGLVVLADCDLEWSVG